MTFGQSSLEGHGPISYHLELMGCFMWRAKISSIPFLDKLMEKFQGKETILNNIMDISENHDNFARYILNDTEGTCGNVGKNPAQQNHASLVAHASGTLYEDPAFEIKTLLCCQRMLEKKSGKIRISASS